MATIEPRHLQNSSSHFNKLSFVADLLSTARSPEQLSGMSDAGAKGNGDTPLPQTHYTISKDATAADVRNNLCAIAERKDFSDSRPAQENKFRAQYGEPPASSPALGQPTLPSSYTTSSTYQPEVLAWAEYHKRRPPLFTSPGIRGQSKMQNTSGVRPSALGFRQIDGLRTLDQPLKTNDLSKDGLGSNIYTPDIMEQPLTQKVSQSRDGMARDIKDHSDVDQSERSNVGLIEQLIRRVQELEAKNAQLQEHQNEGTQDQGVNIQVFHTICQEDDQSDDSSVPTEYRDRITVRDDSTTTFLLVPSWDVRDGCASLRGTHHVPDPSGYLGKKGDVSFVIYKCYDAWHQRKAVNRAIRDNEALPEPEPKSQEFMLVSKEMIEAVRAFFDQVPDFRKDFPQFNERKRMKPPYIWRYHYRKVLKINSLRPRPKQLIAELILWLESTYGALYDQIDAKFSKGLVSSTSLEYLIRPGEVLILNTGNLSQGYVAKSYPVVKDDDSVQANAEDKEGKSIAAWTVPASSLAYTGELNWQDISITVRLVAGSANEDVPITDLNYVPLSHSSAEVIHQLEARGKQKFWRNPRGQLISYDSDTGDYKSATQRYMIDFRTYNELHPPASEGAEYEDMMLVAANSRPYMSKDSQEPEFPEIYLFPSETKGFNFRTKKWSTLEVDRIREVDWNSKAFGSLVADDDTKEMIQALVTNQLATQKGTDLIESKGNGLILLLHGPPGTGKTYTAESVAEIAMKPLYPVTCGDIGTEPREVEEYLNSVFYLGKRWDCVVLLDEAEVFLEQRTLNDLKRNALVSVFLRTLEYYEGILILTTNRVGTFDEAFKSRISLALRYEKLTQVQRKQVWWNFIRRLEDLGEQDTVDLEDLKLHIDELASYPMNGRQIRNSISTARQLALYKNMRMTSTHLRRSITLANKFDDYLGEVRMGEMNSSEEAKKDGLLTDEYFAREDHLR